MKKTIRIDDIKDVHVGDKLFIKGRSDGFRVAYANNDAFFPTIAVDNPFADGMSFVNADSFDHAERTVEEPEWPQPDDLRLHVYLGADGLRYIYNPIDEADTEPWTSENHFKYHARKRMESDCCDALPLTELKLVLKEEES